MGTGRMDEPDGCDVDFLEVDATPDEKLPVAVGGVKIASEGEDVDGCDVDSSQSDTTLDEELPSAAGGVA
jgi:hypothetical protein